MQCRIAVSLSRNISREAQRTEQGSTWTGHQCIAGHTHTCTQTYKAEPNILKEN